MTSSIGASPSAGHQLISFINASPTPYHAVNSAQQRLEKAGFEHLDEKESWSRRCIPGGKYYLTRNASTIVAFAIGKRWQPGNAIAMIGAHTDSPTLRVKPISKKESDGFIQVGVETYGGGLWHTWFDRDLSMAGRIMVKDDENGFTQKLIKIDRPILRIPTLAVHLDRQETFTFNKQQHLLPIAGLIAAELNRQATSQAPIAEATRSKEESDGHFEPLGAITTRHHPRIIEILSQSAGVEPSQVIDLEMILYDTQLSCVGGVNEELIFSPRLDNLEMSFCSTLALIDSISTNASLDDEESIRLISLFDNEEIGSETAQGADSDLLPSIIRRLSVLTGDAEGKAVGDAYEQTLARSFLVSADMAHSVNANYAGKYESAHAPEMNAGVVIKVNANARYATNSPGVVLVQEAARRAGTPLQLFVVRNDSSCGSTIGPMLASRLGVRTVDLGNAQLSMHSIRETTGIFDVENAVKLFTSFFEHYSELATKVHVD